MYQIALCDDEQAELDKIGRMLCAYREQMEDTGFEVRQFAGSSELLGAMRQGQYQPDLVFMDIYMPGESGIEAAEKLRQMGHSCHIIFLTSSRQHALEAFGVEAFSYLVKPLVPGQLFCVLDRILQKLGEDQLRYLLVQEADHMRRIPLCEILYCEAQRKRQCIYLKEGDSVYVNLTLARLCEMLAPRREFTRLGASYIVNLAHIERLNPRMLQLDNGEEIYLPRGSYKALREKYFDYYFNRKNFASMDTKEQDDARGTDHQSYQ